MKLNDLTVAIIAGGKSRRFGKPKSWATLRGKRLIDYAVELALRLSDRVMIVNGKTLDYSSIGIVTVEDAITDCGPIGGLYTALLRSSTEGVIVMPVDMPCLEKAVYEQLLKQMQGDKPVIARSHMGMEPLVSVWYKKNASTLADFIQKKQFSLRAPIQALNSIVVDLPATMAAYPHESFVNINYKEDLEKLVHVSKTG